MGTGRAPEPGLTAFLAGRVASSPARPRGRPAAEGRRQRTGAGGGGRRARAGPGRQPPRQGAACGRALRVPSAEGSRASPPRPAPSPYHVAPPHVEEVSVHHGAVAAALLGHAEHPRVLHPRRRWADRLRTPQPWPTEMLLLPPGCSTHERNASRVEIGGRRKQCVCAAGEAEPKAATPVREAWGLTREEVPVLCGTLQPASFLSLGCVILLVPPNCILFTG